MPFLLAFLLFTYFSQILSQTTGGVVPTQLSTTVSYFTVNSKSLVASSLPGSPAVFINTGDYYRTILSLQRAYDDIAFWGVITRGFESKTDGVIAYELAILTALNPDASISSAEIGLKLLLTSTMAMIDFSLIAVTYQISNFVQISTKQLTVPQSYATMDLPDIPNTNVIAFVNSFTSIVNNLGSYTSPVNIGFRLVVNKTLFSGTNDIIGVKFQMSNSDPNIDTKVTLVQIVINPVQLDPTAMFAHFKYQLDSNFDLTTHIVLSPSYYQSYMPRVMFGFDDLSTMTSQLPFITLSLTPASFIYDHNFLLNKLTYLNMYFYDYLCPESDPLKVKGSKLCSRCANNLMLLKVNNLKFTEFSSSTATGNEKCAKINKTGAGYAYNQVTGYADFVCAQCLIATVGNYLEGGIAKSCATAISNCLECSSATVCTKCADTYTMVDLDGNLGTLENKCQAPGSTNSVTSCPTGQYAQNTLCKSCTSAISNCAECSSGTVCTKCADTYITIDLDGDSATLANKCQVQITSCPVGQYLEANTCKSCSSAISQCQQCSTSTMCSKCSTGYNWADPDNNSTTLNSRCEAVITSVTCTAAQYQENNVCKVCSSTIANCAQCSNATVCTKCDNLYRLVDQDNNLTTPENRCQACLIGQYLQTGICKACVSAISNCVECSSGTVCSKCAVSYSLADLDGNLTTPGNQCRAVTTLSQPTVCAVGLYLDNGVCKSCSIIGNCQQCTSGTVCTKCLASYTLVEAGNNTNTANSQCQPTSQPQTQPTTCASGSYPSNGSCLTCQTPLPNCIECSGPSRCTKCAEQFSLVDMDGNLSTVDGKCVPMVVVCQVGQYLKNGMCYDCATFIGNCVECSDESLCTKCSTQHRLVDADGDQTTPATACLPMNPNSSLTTCNCSSCTNTQCIRCNCTVSSQPDPSGPPTINPVPSPSQQSSLNIGIIVGGSITGIVVIAGILWLVRRLYKKQECQVLNQTPEPVEYFTGLQFNEQFSLCQYFQTSSEDYFRNKIYEHMPSYC